MDTDTRLRLIEMKLESIARDAKAIEGNTNGLYWFAIGAFIFFAVYK